MTVGLLAPSCCVAHQYPVGRAIAGAAESFRIRRAVSSVPCYPTAADAPPHTNRTAEPVPPPLATMTPAASFVLTACCETDPVGAEVVRLVWERECSCGSSAVASQRLNQPISAGRQGVTRVCRELTSCAASPLYRLLARAARPTGQIQKSSAHYRLRNGPADDSRISFTAV